MKIIKGYIYYFFPVKMTVGPELSREEYGLPDEWHDNPLYFKMHNDRAHQFDIIENAWQWKYFTWLYKILLKKYKTVNIRYKKHVKQ